MTRTLVVIPTLGTRPDLLEHSVRSIHGQSVPADILIVAPTSPRVFEIAHQAQARLIEDPGHGLPAAINAGVTEGGEDYEFVTWLGDDDLLTPGSLAATTSALDRNPQAVLAYGACTYIDTDDHPLWTNRAQTWVVPVLSWGPQLIPQPGMLVRASAWHRVEGLNTDYTMAFDLDLLLRLKKEGAFVRVDQVVSCFRWHADSLTVEHRSRNLAESQRAKRAALPPSVRRWCWIWEPPIRWATRLAVARVQRRARKAAAEASR